MANNAIVEGSGTAEEPTPPGELLGETAAEPESLIAGPSSKLTELTLSPNGLLGVSEPANANVLGSPKGLPLESDAAIITRAGLPSLPPMTRAF